MRTYFFFTFLNNWNSYNCLNIFYLPIALSLSFLCVFQYIDFSFVLGHIFMLLCMPDNLWVPDIVMGVRHYRLYLKCWMDM